jgi:hypothetical protein
MASLHELARNLQEKKKVFWQGTASDDAVAKLEQLLDLRLPRSFRQFLREYGGGGVIGQEFSGIEDGDAAIDHKGTVYGDTLLCRREFGLPSQYAVIYFTDDDAVWCLDTSSLRCEECPVVSFNSVTKSVLPMFPTFEIAFSDYVTRRSG